MNAGAEKANGDILLFLHIDTVFPVTCIEAFTNKVIGDYSVWGRFDIRLSGRHIMFRVIEKMMNLRSRATGIATGDQGIFVGKDLFLQCGGFAKVPLMEDVEFCRRMKRMSNPICFSQQVISSSRRWEKYGILNTMLLMWKIRYEYWRGTSPDQLVKQYYT